VLALDSLAEIAAARASGSPPTTLDAFLLLTAPDSTAAARELFDAAPGLRGHTPPLDGRLHALGLASPYEIRAGARRDGFVLAAGKVGSRHGRNTLAATAATVPAAPLLAMSLDLAKLFATMGKQGLALLDGGGGDPSDAELLDADKLGDRMGRVLASFLFVGHWTSSSIRPAKGSRCGSPRTAGDRGTGRAAAGAARPGSRRSHTRARGAILE